MTPQQQVPGIDTRNVGWFEAVTRADEYRHAVKAARAWVASRPAPRFGRRAKADHASWLLGANAVIHVLDQHQTAWVLHARTIEEAAK